MRVWNMLFIAYTPDNLRSCLFHSISIHHSIPIIHVIFHIYIYFVETKKKLFLFSYRITQIHTWIDMRWWYILSSYSKFNHVYERVYLCVWVRARFFFFIYADKLLSMMEEDDDDDNDYGTWEHIIWKSPLCNSL